MSRFLTREEIGEAAAFIGARTGHRPTIGLITGSGLAALADEVAEADTIPYAQIPHFPVSTVEGHPGELVIGRLEGKEVAVMRGRAHFYEGYSMRQVAFPVRVMRALGVKTLIVTNAAGGLNPAFKAGDIMLITDHINLVGMAGLNPLHGPNDPALGPRFVDMSQAYDPDLRALAQRVARKLGFELQQGVYVMSAGPTFETPADVRFLQLIGADAVGMSTVPEVIVARHGGMRVLGLSHISNVIAAGHGMGPESDLHQEVLAAGAAAVPRLMALIRGIIREM
ncbi:MAG TPA: purine-nucleoside phosphorylase [Anaerolineae bacterium]|nr:purine-nucleoside phosphorylase [Anaerolineae bacterium]